ncbi:ELM2 domain-containing protein [Striga asiatica]|uniref:ELM2 domain-containing protein n=1 Tax=Striga asiatica TaxID=4170 RepID=A0A5A7Q5P8_STRAF|nr:ELM2 domain-containing protein [Striga asiatica]
MKMGIKCSLNAEEFPEPSFSLLKTHDYNKRLTLNVDGSHISGAKNVYCELHYDEPLEHKVPNTTYRTNKEFETSAPLSPVVNSSSDEEDSVEGPDSFWPNFLENDFSIPRSPSEQFHNLYASLLYRPPRKEVPIGLDYQVEILMWDPKASRRNLSPFYNERELELMGNGIIPMPDLTLDGLKAGRGWPDCSCHDMGSVRCVQQHVKEARDELLDSVSPDNFMKLGLEEMGEEVAQR